MPLLLLKDNRSFATIQFKEDAEMRKVRGLAAALVIMLAFSFVVLPNGGAAEKKVSINYLTLPLGSALYTVAVTQAQLLSRHTNLEVAVQPASGPAAMPALLASGEAQLATAVGASVWEFYEGIGIADKPYPMMRALQAGHDQMFAFVTREDTGIKTISDLKGRKVTSNYPATRVVSTIGLLELQAYGLDPAKDVTLLKAENNPKGIADVGDGRTDAAVSSIEGAMIKELAAKTKVRVLPFAADKMSFVSQKLPGTFLIETRPGLTGVEPGLPVVSTPSLLYSTSALPDDMAYLIVKTLIEKQQEMVPAAPDLMIYYTGDRAVRKMPIPYHNGAIRYYKEKGLWSAEMDKFQEEVLQKVKK
jgi:uncharacterized protein